jgi:phage baseplate assembly protein W
MWGFLGRGWHFPPQVDDAGSVVLSEGERKIRQSIHLILATAKGERVMRPEFGCGVHSMAFDVINPSTLGAVRAAVMEALILWEPRIEVLEVEAASEAVAHDPGAGALLVRIDYRVRATNTDHNMVYPFLMQARRPM